MRTTTTTTINQGPRDRRNIDAINNRVIFAVHKGGPKEKSPTLGMNCSTSTLRIGRRVPWTPPPTLRLTLEHKHPKISGTFSIHPPLFLSLIQAGRKLVSVHIGTWIQRAAPYYDRSEQQQKQKRKSLRMTNQEHK